MLCFINSQIFGVIIGFILGLIPLLIRYLFSIHKMKIMLRNEIELNFIMMNRAAPPSKEKYLYNVSILVDIADALDTKVYNNFIAQLSFLKKKHLKKIMHYYLQINQLKRHSLKYKNAEKTNSVDNKLKEIIIQSLIWACESASDALKCLPEGDKIVISDEPNRGMFIIRPEEKCPNDNIESQNKE